MIPILTIVHVLAAIAIIALVLLQHGRGADAGAAFGAGSAGSVFGARGPASFLTRATAALATVFFLTSLSLAYLSGQQVERRSLTERVGEIEQPVEKSEGPSDVPSVPTGGTGSDVPSVPGTSPAGDTAPANGESGASGNSQ